MSLKLFRSTGYSSILAPGESRLATHPAWLVLAVSLWIGFACNVALWRAIGAASPDRGLGQALLAGGFIAAACATVLSLLGWRRTLKRTATVLLLLAALVAASIWVQGRPLGGDLFEPGLRALLLPSWASLLRWQFPALLTGVGLIPMLWVWQLQVRRLPGPRQMASNATGMLVGVLCMAGTGWFLLGGP
ncbi:MAG: putative rane protein [Ramlibacter sp.]|nr:putative rane protein [Ramlibacter sp.]